MKVKTFTGATIDEALAAVKNDMGDSVLILETRTSPGVGPYGAFGQRTVAVTVADDPNGEETTADPSTVIMSSRKKKKEEESIDLDMEEEEEEPSNERKHSESHPQPQAIRSQQALEELLPADPTQISSPRTSNPSPQAMPVSRNATALPYAQTSTSMPSAQLPGILQRVQDLNTAGTDIALEPITMAPANDTHFQTPHFLHLPTHGRGPHGDQLASYEETAPQQEGQNLSALTQTQDRPLPTSPNSFTPPTVDPHSVYPAAYRTILEHLIEQDLPVSLARSLMNRILRSQGPGASLSSIRDEIKSAFASAIRSAPVKEIEKKQTDKKKLNAPNIIAFVGPAGVGKTTALAKLAAEFAIRKHYSVGMISIETSTVETPDTLQGYGELMGVPTRQVHTPAQLKKAIKELSDRNYLFIDSPAFGVQTKTEQSKSKSHRLDAKSLQAFFDAAPNIQTHLVLSATTRLKDLLASAQAFSPLSLDGLLFTRLDETDAIGHLVGLTKETNLPISYLSTGQEIPDDLEPANGEGLAERILRET